MSAESLAQYVALGVGSFQFLANSALLFRGFSRLPEELAKEGAAGRIADLLRTAWVYGMLGNLCISVLLIVIAVPLRTGEPLARHLAAAIGVYYVVLGFAAYTFAPSRHPGLLVFTALGIGLLAPLWLSR